MLNEHGPMLATATGRRVIAVSPPGWETPELEPVEYLPSALVRRLLGLFDELNLEPLSFVGFSWGATIGCHLAAHAPERLDALVLLDAGYTDFQDRPGYEELDLEGVIGTNHGWKALERFRRAVPRARVEEVDSGHDLLSDAPEETISIIGRFLAGMAPRAIPEV